ncbi:MAG: TetR family transcriptional regulator [Acidobacteria bacterium]|nr:TetR family transcriptional regulator [Acidobacteriota bacterium]
MATRAALVELAAEMFAEQGYLQTSIRDIAQRASLTTGAIYGHFRNKADLLAEAISSRTGSLLETLPAVMPPSPAHVEILRSKSYDYSRRRSLRALILQGAAAALTDPETRERLRDEQMRHIRSWIDGYEATRAELEIDPSVDLQAAVLYTWSAEVGLGVLEAIGIEPRTRKGWADMAARFGRSLTLPPED